MSFKGSLVYSHDDENLIAAGLITGISNVNKFGRNTDVDTATVPEDIWDGGGTYTGFPTTGSAEQLGISSSNANDTAAGTGARSLTVIGLDANYNIISETVSLAGLTEVFTTQSFWRVHTAYVASSGGTPLNSNFAVGSIRVRHRTTTANVFLQMPVGSNQSNNAGYTVPLGYTVLIKRVHGAIRGSTSASADIALWIRQYGMAPRLRRPTTLYYGNELDDNIYGGISIPEKTDLHLRIISASANNLDVVGGYDLVLIKKA